MILTDSGFWVALGNCRDRYHNTAREALVRWSGEGFATTLAGAERSVPPVGAQGLRPSGVEVYGCGDPGSVRVA